MSARSHHSDMHDFLRLCVFAADVSPAAGAEVD